MLGLITEYKEEINRNEGEASTAFKVLYLATSACM